MEIRGKEVGMLMTIGAYVQISKLCPNGDLKRLSDMFGDNYATNVENIVGIIVALNGGFVASEALEGRKAFRLTEEMVLALSPDEFASLQNMALATITKGSKGEVEAKTGKKEEAGED
jgi:hypothetical protein